MNPLKVGLVTVLAGGISIGAAIFGQRWMAEHPVEQGPIERSATRLQTLPDFRLRDLEGREFTSNTWAGKILVLNYWASWCPPCVRELPLLIRTQEALGGSGVQVVGIALDRPEDVGRFVADYPVNFPILIGTPAVIALAKRLGNRVEGLPFTVIFDRRGRRVFSHIGEITAEQLQTQLGALVDTETLSLVPAPTPDG